MFFFCFSRKGTSLLFALVLVFRDGNYMSIPRVWSSASRTRVRILFSTYSCLARPTTRPFQDVDEPLRSLLSNGRPSSNLTKILKRGCKYTLTLLPPMGDTAAVSVEMALLAQELRSDKQYGGGVRGISSLYVLKAIMGKIGLSQKEALIGTSECGNCAPLLYFLANGNRTESSISCTARCKPCLHQNEALAGMCMEITSMLM